MTAPAIDSPECEKLVKGFAGKHQGCGVEFNDLAQEGYLGLLHAAALFDPARERTFEQYARWWVKAYVIDAIHSQVKPMRIPRWVRKLHYRGVTSDSPGLNPSKRACLVALERVFTATLEPAKEELLPEPESEPLPELEAALAKLPPRELRIIRLRYGLDGGEALSLRATAERIGGITKERVRQLEKLALAKLRSELE